MTGCFRLMTWLTECKHSLQLGLICKIGLSAKLPRGGGGIELSSLKSITFAVVPMG